MLGNKKIVKATGGGAHKFAELFERKLGVQLKKEDEMAALITGTNFLLRHVPYESFTIRLDPELRREYVSTGGQDADATGSGVSVIRVDNEKSYQRIDGSSLGGGTFWGLCRLLTGMENFEEMLTLSARGDNTKVDLTVGDIYGSDYSKVGLSAQIIASSFGKMMMMQSRAGPPSPADVAASLLKMVCNNIAQIAYHNAMRAGIERIYFGGFFIRNHPPTMRGIWMGVNFWSGGRMRPYFLLHEGYLGALGAFLSGELMPDRTADRLVASPAPAPSLSTSSWLSLLKSLSFRNWTIDVGPLALQLEKMECECGCEFCEGLVCKKGL